MTEMRVYLNRAVGLAAVAAFALGGAAFAQCDIVCPDGASQEGEPCGQDTNGGCNMDTPQFEPIAIGEYYCGTAWSEGEGGSRDTDWYEIEITEPMTLYWSGKAEFNFVVGLVEYQEGTEGSGNCDDNTGYISPYAAGSPCSGAAVEVEITVPGTYWFFFAPIGPDIVECNGSPDYAVALTTELPNGACCLPDNTCLDDVSFEECVNNPNNGQFMGPLTDCTEVECVSRPCPTDPTSLVLTDSVDQFTILSPHGIACAIQGPPQETVVNYYARSYDLDQIDEIAGEDFFYITCVELGVETNSGNADVMAHCNIFRDTNGGDPWKINADLLLIESKDFIIPPGTGQEVFPIVFGEPVEFDMHDPDYPNVLVVEMHIESAEGSGGGVWPGTNDGGQTGPTYWYSPPCNENIYTTMEDIGYPDVHWVNNVIGSTIKPGRNIWVDGEAFPPFDEQGNVQPVTNPTGDWVELWPNFATDWTCTGWDDSNEDGVVSICDYLNMITDGEDETTWHVEWIGLTVWVKYAVGGEDLYYLEFRGNLEDPDFPLGLYHEVYPSFCNDWLASDYIDANGSGLLDAGDFYTFEINGGEGEFYEVVGLATDIELLEFTEEQPPCPWDFDGDGDVDTADLLFLLGAWGTPNGDVDGDGDTDTADLLALLAHWGQCPS
jgi:hypothetical protein